MSTRMKKIALPQIKEFHDTLVKVNEGYYKENVNKKDFYLRSNNIAQRLAALNDGGKTYFNNVQLKHLLSKFVRWEELDGTIVTLGTILATLVKAWDLTKMTLVFWQIMPTNILPQVGHRSELSSYAMYTLWRILAAQRINLSSLIVNHMWRCQNQKRVCYPMEAFSRLSSSKPFWKWSEWLLLLSPSSLWTTTESPTS